MNDGTKARDAFDDFLASQHHNLHNLTIAEIFMAGFDDGRQYEQDRAAEWDFGRAAMTTRTTDA